MGAFMKTLLKAGLGLTSATLLVMGLQAQAAADEVMQPGIFLLAQNAEQKKEKQPTPKPPSKEPGQMKSMEPSSAPKVKKGKRKARGRQEPPAAAGTKKMGGQTIRDRESLENE